MAKPKNTTPMPKGSKKQSSISSKTKDTEDSSTTKQNTTDTLRKSLRTNNKQKDTTTKPDKVVESPTKKKRLTYAESVSNQDSSDNSDEGDDDMSMGSYRLHDHYITIKLQMDASPTYLQDLRDKYIMLIKTLQEVDETLIIKGVNVAKDNKAIKNPDQLPERNI